jgi:myo-inositol-1(or 4)-monophosphatase
MKRDDVETTPTPERDFAAVLAAARPFAVELALEAGALLRDYQAGEFTIEYKGAVDLVTDADKASEKLIADRIHETFPGHRLTGEEGARGVDASKEAPFGWVIDPLDGTTNFAHHYPHFAVSICLEYLGEPVLGVVYDPMRDELFVATTGDGATLNGAPLKVNATGNLQQALLATGFSYTVSEREEGTALWIAFNNGAQGLRRDGAAALDMCWVAAGRLDGYFERPVNAWDIGAGVVIVREAGGEVSSLERDHYDLYGTEVIATNANLMTPIRELVASTLATSRAVTAPNT